MKVLITGATGLIGKAILDRCEKGGHEVHFLTTSKAKIGNFDGASGFYWNPSTQEIDENCLEGVDAILNLAGASISKRWTKPYKNDIVNSRVDSLKTLYKLLTNSKHHVKQLVSASAIGVYPSSYSKSYDESEKEISNSFLGEVVEQWENEADTFSNLGLQVCKIRIGIVLSGRGGALEQMKKPVQYGMGAPLGNGKQFQSWIHIGDLANLFIFSLEHELKGIYNAVAPQPVTNKELTKAIAKQLKKPLFLPNVPSFVLKLVLGEMATIVLESQKVANQKITDRGFNFDFTTVEDALKDCL